MGWKVWNILWSVPRWHWTKFSGRLFHTSVPHKWLSEKIRGLGLGSIVSTWIGDFLHDRKMKVCVRGSYSEWIDVISGVPQDSVLGPLLFLIFMQDLPDWVKNSIKMFADNTKIWMKIASQGDADSLQQDLDKIHTMELSFPFPGTFVPWGAKVPVTKISMCYIKHIYDHI